MLIENDWENAAARTRSGIVEDTERSYAGVAAQEAAGVVYIEGSRTEKGLFPLENFGDVCL